MKKNHYGLIMSVLINILFLLGMAYFVGFYYELSDDWFFSRNIANGNYNYTFCSYFIQYLTGLLQKWIYPVNAFMLLQIIFAFISLTTIFYIFFDLYDFEKGLFFAVLVESLFCVNFYSIITFSKTAAILATAGGLVMLWAYHGKKHIGYSIYGIILVLLGSFYRMKIFYAVAAVFCVCIGSIILCKVKKPFWKSLVRILKDIFTVKTTALILSVLVLVFGCNFISTQLIMASDEGLEYYKEYNHLRSTLVDYPLPEYAETAEELQSIGISENDYNMLLNWYFDDQGYGDMETMKGIIAVQQQSKYSKSAILARLQEMLDSAVTAVKEFTSEGIVLLTFLILSVMIILIYKNMSWIHILIMMLGVGVLYAYLWSGGRIKFRAILPIWIAVVICLLYTVRFLKYRTWVKRIRKRFPKISGTISTLTAVVLCCVLQFYTATVIPEENSIVNDYDYSALTERIVTEEDKTFVLSYDSYKFLRNKTVLQDPLYVGPDAVFDRCLYFGSPYYAHPSYNELLESYGVDNLYTDIVDNEDFYFVDRRNVDIEMFLGYLTEQYGENGPYSFELIDVLSNHYIYQIRTGGTNKAIVLRSQPMDVTVADGERAEVVLDVVGVGLTYEWYYANKGSDEFHHTDAFDGRKYYVDMASNRDGRQIYCVITDQYGNSVQTEPVTLRMSESS